MMTAEPPADTGMMGITHAAFRRDLARVRLMLTAAPAHDETRLADYFADPVTGPAAASGAGTPGRSAQPVAGNRVVFVPGNGQMTSQRPTATGPHARHRRH